MSDFNVIAQTPWGQCLYNRHDTNIGQCLADFGEYSEEELHLLRLVAPVGSVVLDVGANIGALAVPLAQHVGPAGAVIAFEPQRHCFNLLCANAALNSLDNLYPVRCAVGVTSGLVEVLALDPNLPNAHGSLSLRQIILVEGATEKVGLVPIDGFDEAMLARVSLIKIDVEGMEMDVLQGAAATIMRRRPVIYIENDRVETSAVLIQTIMEMSYNLFWSLPRLVRYREDLKQTPMSDLRSFNMLCLPSEAGHNTDLEPVLGIDDTPKAAMARTVEKLYAELANGTR